MGAENNSILKSQEDFTVYLVKKIFLEGKTLKEINKDFHNDVVQEFKSPESFDKDGTPIYFIYSTLKSLGVEYPDISYWQSYLATRDDRNIVRKSNYYEDGRQKKVYSEATIKKMSEAKTKWWADLSDEDYNDLIAKMENGQRLSQSTFVKYKPPIMTIAADKVGLSSKLSQFMLDKYSNEEFINDFADMSERQKAIMDEFWTKNQELKIEYSEAIKNTILDFENTDKIEEYIEIAKNIKLKNLENHKIRKQERQKPYIYKPQTNSVPTKEPVKDEKYYKKECRRKIKNLFKIMPSEFADNFLNYFMNDKRVTPEFLKQLSTENSDINELNKVLLKIHADFDNKYKKLCEASLYALADAVYSKTKDPKVYLLGRPELIEYVEKRNLSSEIISMQKEMDKSLKVYQNTLTKPKAEEFFKSVVLKKLDDMTRRGPIHTQYCEYKDEDHIYSMKQLADGTKFMLQTAVKKENFSKLIAIMMTKETDIKFISANKSKNPELADIILEFTIVEALKFAQENNIIRFV